MTARKRKMLRESSVSMFHIVAEDHDMLTLDSYLAAAGLTNGSIVVMED